MFETSATVDGRQALWVNRLADGISGSELETTARVLGELCRRLETDREDAENGEGGNE